MRLKDKVAVITGASAGFGMSRGFPEGFGFKLFCTTQGSNGSF